eukprot:scaffold280046_cov35-Tisochrysis_lutea.AAC.2
MGEGEGRASLPSTTTVQSHKRRDCHTCMHFAKTPVVRALCSKGRLHWHVIDPYGYGRYGASLKQKDGLGLVAGLTLFEVWRGCKTLHHLNAVVSELFSSETLRIEVGCADMDEVNRSSSRSSSSSASTLSKAYAVVVMTSGFVLECKTRTHSLVQQLSR